nr:hypothetical protein [uncultured Allomuricauda sp.]
MGITIIKKIPWKALFILSIGFVSGLTLGVNFGHKVSWLSFEKTLNSKTVSEAVNKPTVTNEISNDISVGKVKNSEGIEIVLDPVNNQKPVNIISNDTCLKMDLTKLTDGQRRRLDRWLGQ